MSLYTEIDDIIYKFANDRGYTVIVGWKDDEVRIIDLPDGKLNISIDPPLDGKVTVRTMDGLRVYGKVTVDQDRLYSALGVALLLSRPRIAK